MGYKKNIQWKYGILVTLEYMIILIDQARKTMAGRSEEDAAIFSATCVAHVAAAEMQSRMILAFMTLHSQGLPIDEIVRRVEKASTNPYVTDSCPQYLVEGNFQMDLHQALVEYRGTDFVGEARSFMPELKPYHIVELSWWERWANEVKRLCRFVWSRLLSEGETVDRRERS